MSRINNISNHPFAQYSAEEESNLEAIYYKQQYYQELLDLTKNGVSRFILGQRGQGKSATIHHLIGDLKKSSVLPVLIRRYDDYPKDNNKEYYLYSIIQGIVFALAEYLYANPKSIKKLNDTQKNEIGVLIEAFYDEWLAEEFLEKAKRIKQIRKINFWKRLWNYFGVGMANKALSTATQITAQLIQSYTGTNPNFSISEGEYFQGVKYSEIKTMPKSEIVKFPPANLVKIVQNLVDISQVVGFGTVVILFDQIDEVRCVNSEVEKVAEFMLDFLSDTNLLYLRNLSIVISLWSEAKNQLNIKNIRFDKFKEIDIRWRDEELVKLMDKRLLFYSIDKNNPVTFSSLIPDHGDQEIIINLSGGSPRALITLMSYILSEEQSEDLITAFSADAISKGCIAFCKKFDYISFQPSRTGKGSNLKDWIVKLLRMRLTKFNLQQYCAFYSISSSSRIGGKHVNQMLKFNLIKDALLPSKDGKPIYEVVDPRLIYLISRGVLEID